MGRAFLAAAAIAALIAVLGLVWSVRAARAQDMEPRCLSVSLTQSISLADSFFFFMTREGFTGVTAHHGRDFDTFGVSLQYRRFDR
jgi:hypothetical protein